jgi:hypothetical protein
VRAGSSTQQIAEAAAEVVVLGARWRGEQAGVALQVGPARAASVAVEVVELDGLLAQEAGQPDVLRPRSAA